MDVHPLTPVENEIIIEICRYLAMRVPMAEEVGDVIGILGCWGDTLPEEDILSLLRAVNSHATSNSPRHSGSPRAGSRRSIS